MENSYEEKTRRPRAFRSVGLEDKKVKGKENKKEQKTRSIRASRTRRNRSLEGSGHGEQLRT